MAAINFKVREKLLRNGQDVEQMMCDTGFVTDECDRFERLLRSTDRFLGDKDKDNFDSVSEHKLQSRGMFRFCVYVCYNIRYFFLFNSC